MNDTTSTDQLFLDIAKRHMPSVETLETRNRDALDFHDVAVCSIRNSLAEAYAAVADELAEIKGSIFGRIEQRWGLSIVDVVQEISAGLMPADVVQTLRVKREAVGMRFRRSYSLQDGTLVLTSINWHPADRFVYATRMKRNAE
jgi:DNA-binding GntR family transcriptional regulator